MWSPPCAVTYVSLPPCRCLVPAAYRTVSRPHLSHCHHLTACSGQKHALLSHLHPVQLYHSDSHIPAAAQVLGNRRLQDHEVIGQLIRDAHHTWGPGYLHVFVRLDDIQSLQVESRLGQLHHFQQQPQDSPRSALTASLTASPRPPVGPSRAGKPVAGRAQAPGPATRKGCCDR